MLDVQSVVKHLSRELDLKQSVVEFENTKGMLSKDEGRYRKTEASRGM